MLKLMRNVYIAQSVCSKSMTGILGSRIVEVNSGKKCSYSMNLKGKSDEVNPNPNSDETRAKPKKKSFTSPRITLISNDLAPTVITLEEAEKLSKRRDLKLVKVMDVDHKTQRAVYKLMTGAEYYQEDLNRRKEKSVRKQEDAKEPKLLTLSFKIEEHDLRSKIKNMIKWLNKRHEVRIVINTSNNDEAVERIYAIIETETRHCSKIVQKRKQGVDLKFQLIPLKKKDTDTDEKSTKELDPATMHLES